MPNFIHFLIFLSIFTLPGCEALVAAPLLGYCMTDDSCRARLLATEDPSLREVESFRCFESQSKLYQADTYVYDADIEQRTMDMLIEHLDVSSDQITTKSKFRDELGMDNLDSYEIRVAASEEFGIEFTSFEIANICTVGDFVRIIDVKSNGLSNKNSSVFDLSE